MRRGTYAVKMTVYNDTFPAGVNATSVIVEVVDLPIYYVNQTNETPLFPYTNWQTAAKTIQEAVAAGATPGRWVCVSNGVYDSGGVVVDGTLTNRVALTSPVILRSVNGPGVTLIRGAEAPGGGNGDGATRCAYVGANAVLSGFTLTNGHTGTNWNMMAEPSGGGVWCETGGVVSNCLLTGNSAFSGGGASGGMLSHCTLTGNSAQQGGGAAGGKLCNCVLIGNSASSGGGALLASLYNCTLSANSATNEGGGVFGGTLDNCIVYYNTAQVGPNYFDLWMTLDTVFNYSCTVPLPVGGSGNITNEPGFVSTVGGDFRLCYRSMCIDAGNPLSEIIGTDIAGNLRPIDGNGDGLAGFDMGAYEYNPKTMDSDGDGATDYEEFVAGTNPTNASSCLRITAIVNGPLVMVSFLSSPNQLYTLYSCTNLAALHGTTGEWSPVPGQTDVRGSGGLDTLRDNRTASRRFYRVGVRTP